MQAAESMIRAAREVCDVHLESGDILVQPGETSHKANGDGEDAMLAVIELAQ